MKKLILIMAIAAGLSLLGCNDETQVTGLSAEDQERLDRLDSILLEDSISLADSLRVLDSLAALDDGRPDNWPALGPVMDMTYQVIAQATDWAMLPDTGLRVLVGFQTTQTDWSRLWGNCSTLEYFGYVSASDIDQDMQLPTLAQRCTNLKSLSVTYQIDTQEDADQLELFAGRLECLDISEWPAGLDMSGVLAAVKDGGKLISYNIMYSEDLPPSVVSGAASRGITLVTGSDWTEECPR